MFEGCEIVYVTIGNNHLEQQGLMGETSGLFLYVTIVKIC